MSVDPQSLEDLMEEYSTIPDYENVPSNAITPQYLTVRLWLHQYQAMYLALKAEASPPVVNKDGEVFYSRSGIMCLGTGTGKTMIMLGIANFSVDKSAIDANIASTSLNIIKLNKRTRQNIDCTIICGERKIVKDAWLSDLQKGYPQLPYYFFETIGTFESEIEKSFEMLTFKQKQTQIKQFIGEYYNNLLSKQIDQQAFEIAMIQFGDIRSKEDVEEYYKKMEEEYKDALRNAVNNALIRIMSTVKIFFVTKDSFYFLFDFFRSYTVSRIILDEPQNTTLTKQDFFKEYIKDPRMKKLKSAGMGKMLPYYEESPCRFLWYVSATPHLIPDNDSGHYFNSWVSKNDFVITDYATNLEEGRLFPELVERYVIKFPYSYIVEKSRPEFKKYINRYNLKCTRSAEAAILRGALGDEFDQMLENDDYEGVVSKLGVGGNISTILDDVIQRLTIEIKKHVAKISSYDPATPQHVIDKSEEKLADERLNLLNLQKRIARYRGIENSATHENCSICLEELHLIPKAGDNNDQRCISHMSCMNIFHIGCLKPIILGQNKKCPMCREQLREEDLKLTCDSSGKSLQQQTQEQDMQRQDSLMKQQVRAIDTEKFYDSKNEALKTALGPMVRDGQYRNRSKVLLFVEFRNDDSAKCDEIIKLCQDAGFNVRLPNKVGTKDQLAAKFPIRNGKRVEQAGAANIIKKEIEKFRDSHEPFVWIFRSGKESSGLSFPFCDTSIEYSTFKSHLQIQGRTLRLNRVVPVDLIRLDYV